MAITKKAQSAIYHLNVAKRDADNVESHIMQAKVALRKDDEASRDAIANVQRMYNLFTEAVTKAAETITTYNPATKEDE